MCMACQFAVLASARPLRDHAMDVVRDGNVADDADVIRAGIIAPNGKEIFNLGQVIDQLTRPNVAWTGVNGNPTPRAGIGIISYGFFETAAQVYSSERNQFVPLSLDQRIAVRNAFAMWSDMIPVQFVERDSSNADINIGNINTTENYYSAYANYPGNSLAAGDIWINLNGSSTNDVGLGGAGARTLMHEMGHSLGLSHPGAYNAAPGVTLTYENNAEYFQDSLQYTIMSYFASSNTGAVRSGFAATPLTHDIAAIQSLYGANMTTRTGDTHYGFNNDSDRQAYNFAANTNPVVSIWDAGGRDTLDFSGWSTNSKLDLNEGSQSDGGGQTTNIQIAYGTTLEIGITGAGNDTLIGNQVGNVLIGGAGDDNLRGGAGNDRLEGGSGADTFVFGAIGESHTMTARSDGKKLIPDMLTDFQSGTDKIDLHLMDANTGTAGDEAFSWIGSSAFSNVAGQLRADVIGNQVHIYGDVNGDGRADLHIIASGTQILVTDFIL